MSTTSEAAAETTTAPIYMVTVSAGTNIAVIKYWGKASKEYNTPINDSVSITLDQKDLCAITTVAASTSFTQDRLWLNGVEDVNAATNVRFRACIDGVKALATDVVMDGSSSSNSSSSSSTTTTTATSTVVTKAQWQSMYIHVSSYNTFPTAAGLASSAAGYAALVASLAQLVQAKEEYPYQLSTIARQGSGSACRSLYGGFVAWRQGTAAQQWNDSIAEPICPDTAEHHWPEIRALILVVSDAKKDTSSTSGMSTSVATSTLLQHRAKQVVPERMEQIIQAWKAKDFNTFGKITMQDSNQFHCVCLDTYPPIFYMNDVSRNIIRLVTSYNKYYKDEIRAAYTFDAGPNAVLYCLEEHAVEIGALMLHYYPMTDLASYWNDTQYGSDIASYTLDPQLLEACDALKIDVAVPGQEVRKMYYTKSGSGPQVVSTICNLDPKTGWNTYHPK
jgi:diphosphomevalonate decarboxylase